ncbi:MAG: hypothetical protein A2Y97_02935 [Nitrospirae bacterium RBG_13_39_12]|nr:MAG: hypothetical protein A2Y97_02935 [Nitrospirae bacterium RBG_13_39_12]
MKQPDVKFSLSDMFSDVFRQNRISLKMDDWLKENSANSLDSPLERFVFLTFFYIGYIIPNIRIDMGFQIFVRYENKKD